ncbi:hypothetical protein QFC20_004726 [Naganishia adeliensis]|uniref:Uncharacterized protein n=1 Tax=Naganishia adeliensis TaxID=92952 RepID=A0ACC2VXY3_9TREE|nr:hypothetical protein QFC20_004726 [Naganishia adeliensis]
MWPSGDSGGKGRFDHPPSIRLKVEHPIYPTTTRKSARRKGGSGVDKAAVSGGKGGAPAETALPAPPPFTTPARPNATLAQQPYNSFDADGTGSAWTPAIVRNIATPASDVTLASAIQAAALDSASPAAVVVPPAMPSVVTGSSAANSEKDWREEAEKLQALLEEERRYKLEADDARVVAERRVAQVQKKARVDRLQQLSKQLAPIPRPRRPRAANWTWARMEEILGLPPPGDKTDTSDVKKARAVLYRWILSKTSFDFDSGC